MNDRARRIAENEERFRVFNDEVRAVRTELGADADFACECGDPHCAERIQLSLEDYTRLREDRRRFVVLPGHERPDVELVVERHVGHRIVEKTGEGADIVK